MPSNGSNHQFWVTEGWISKQLSVGQSTTPWHSGGSKVLFFRPKDAIAVDGGDVGYMSVAYI